MAARRLVVPYLPLASVRAAFAVAPAVPAAPVAEPGGVAWSQRWCSARPARSEGSAAEAEIDAAAACSTGEHSTVAGMDRQHLSELADEDAIGETQDDETGGAVAAVVVAAA